MLDCGCGKGTIALGLAQAIPTGRIIGVDLDKGCLATARGHANLLGRKNLSCTVADGRQLPFSDETFATQYLKHWAIVKMLSRSSGASLSITD